MFLTSPALGMMSFMLLDIVGETSHSHFGPLLSSQLLEADGKSQALMCKITEQMGVGPCKIPEFNLDQPGARREILLRRRMNKSALAL